MPKYFVDLVMTVLVEADSHEEAEGMARELAEEKLGSEGMHALVVQPAEETLNDA
jgi:hypothetical protein